MISDLGQLRAEVVASSRIVLVFLLLGIDWYFDTSFGTSPFTRPMYSTEVVCSSLGHKHNIQQQIDGPDVRDPAPIASPIQPSPSPHPLGGEVPVSILSGADPVYSFMSMQC